jgi:hypothetical protein
VLIERKVKSKQMYKINVSGGEERRKKEGKRVCQVFCVNSIKIISVCRG